MSITSSLQDMRTWTKGTRDRLKFGIPMIWREPKDHVNDCYFCIVKIAGFNKKTRYKISYPNLDSAIHPVPHSNEVPVPVFDQLPTLEDEDDITEDISEWDSDADFPDVTSTGPQRFD